MTDDSKGKQEPPPAPRKRSLTSLSLEWLAERMKKAERIKAELAAGKYRVSSKAVAGSIFSDQDEIDIAKTLDEVPDER